MNPRIVGSSMDPVSLQPQAYEFGYTVKDQATGNDFGRRESSDGETVRGEYRVQLPDGRTQIVTYHADWRTGFHADVRYEGTANYPDQNGYNNGGQGFGYPGGNFGSGGGGGGGNFGGGGFGGRRLSPRTRGYSIICESSLRGVQFYRCYVQRREFLGNFLAP